MNELINIDKIGNRIFHLRGRYVILDSDLAELYGVETKQLTRQVRRNLERFPDDFMYLLTNKEVAILRCQIGTSRWGGRRHLPYAFTEQGIAMLSSVLNSERAVSVNIQIMRAFVELRREALTYASLKRKITALENKYDEQFKVVFSAIEEILAEEEKPKRRIGFHE